MIKLLHISPSYFPAFRFGGPIQSVHLLNKSLVKKGVKVDVLTTKAGLTVEQREKIKERSNSEGWCLVDSASSDKSDYAVTSGVRVKYLSFVGYEHYNFSIQMVKEIWKIIDDYDIVHITAVWNFPVLVGSVISFVKNKPYIISTRGALHQEALSSKSAFVKKLYFNLLAKHYLKKAFAIHYTTEVEKEESELVLKHKDCFVIPNGIDLREIDNRDQRSEIRITEKYILILGRIDRIKGFDILIPAFANIIVKYNDLKLVVAGDDTTPYTKEVRKMIEAQNISNKVIFTGQVIGDDKWSLYKNALMFVLPSYSENFGMSVVEAMACGCPVVISDKVGIYKEVAVNNAGIIVSTIVESVAEGIKKLLNDENLKRTIAANGKTMVEKYYDIDKVSDSMIIQYKKIWGH